MNWIHLQCNDIQRWLCIILLGTLMTSSGGQAAEVITLFDNFSNETISADRFYNPEGRRVVEDGKAKFDVATSSNNAGHPLQALYTPPMPMAMALTAIEAKLNLASRDLRARNAIEGCVRVGGIFYTTSSTSTLNNFDGDVLSLIFLCVDSDGNTGAYYRIFESDSPSFATETTIASGTITETGISLDTEYVAKVVYDNADGFTFTFNGTSVTDNGPTRGTDSANNAGTLGTVLNLGPGGDDFKASVKGEFDDVKLNNASSVYDDFSGAAIDQFRWKGFGIDTVPEVVTDVTNGEIRLRSKSATSERQANRVSIKPPYNDTSYLEAELELLSRSTIPTGTDGRARITGYFYNDLYPSAAGSNFRQGNVWAQLVIRQRDDGVMNAFAFAEEVTDATHSVDGTELFFHNFAKAPAFDTKYKVSIRLDEANKQLIYDFDGEVYTYNILTNIYPVPTSEANTKNVQVRSSSGPGEIYGSFDNIRIAIDSPFSDAAPAAFQDYVNAVSSNNIATGCNLVGDLFCPDEVVTRELVPIWLLKLIETPAYTPPSAVGTVFSDVGAAAFAADWIEEFYNRGLTDGCSLSPLTYCPKQALTKESAAMLILKAKNGSGYTPPTATGTVFDDVSAGDPFAPWIETFYNDGFADGCDVDNYCPEEQVSMTGFAAMVSKAFGLLNP